jgi:hypothetical protein
MNEEIIFDQALIRIENKINLFTNQILRELKWCYSQFFKTKIRKVLKKDWVTKISCERNGNWRSLQTIMKFFFMSEENRVMNRVSNNLSNQISTLKSSWQEIN